jgi:hypothetical protein
MAAFMAIAGSLGALATVIETLREVLKGAGIDPEDITRIVGELIRRLRSGRSDRGDEAPLPAPWEYSVVTLSEKRSWGRTKGVMPTLRDGVKIPSTDLATYLNQVSTEGWEILSTIGGEKAPILVLVRPKPAL